jgi:hypothetical protein
MAFGWTVLGVGLASGLILGLRGLTVPLVYEIAIWIAKALSGDLVNRSGNGDNLAGEAIFAGLLGVVVGTIGVLAGTGLRRLFRRHWHAH